MKKFLKFIFKNLDQIVGNLLIIQYLAESSESFSGAEIRQSIIEGMYHAFYEKREFTTDDICIALKELIPLAHLESDQMIKLQNWASSGRNSISFFKTYIFKLIY